MFRRIATSRRSRQSTYFFSSQAANAVLGIAVYGLLTRALTVDDFGSYAFVTSYIVFTLYFFDFGLSSSTMRLMAIVEPGQASRNRLGTLLLAAGALGVVYAMFIALSSFVIERIFPGNLGGALLMLSPLACAYPVQEVLLSAGQGSNSIGFLSVFYLLPRVLLGLAILLLSQIMQVTLLSALFATMGSVVLAIVLALWYLKPEIARVKAEVPVLKREIREFGRQVYSGRIIDGLTSGTDRMLISHFHGMAPLGFYAIAMTMSSPISMMSRSIATISYQRFAWEKRLSKKLLIANLVWCIGVGIVLFVACELLIPILFTTKYSGALTVLPLLICAAMFAGLNAPFHAFLSAQRQGRSIKVMSVSTSLFNVILNVLLIPFYSMIGAGIALVSSSALNVGMNAYYYRKFLTTQTHATDEIKV